MIDSSATKQPVSDGESAAGEWLDCRWIGGNCPVQAEGFIDGKEFYFRARGESWRMNIGGDVVLDPEWTYEEDYGDLPFAAGWMTKDEAWAFIKKAADLYRSPAVKPDKHQD